MGSHTPDLTMLADRAVDALLHAFTTKDGLEQIIEVADDVAGGAVYEPIPDALRSLQAALRLDEDAPECLFRNWAQQACPADQRATVEAHITAMAEYESRQRAFYYTLGLAIGRRLGPHGRHGAADVARGPGPGEA